MTGVQATSSQTVTALAPAKLNLSLHILGKRADGYHDLLTLFQSVDLCDQICFSFSHAQQNHLDLRIEGSSAYPDFPLDNSNIINKAAALFWHSQANLAPKKITATISKNIPIGAGLAGGSANGAATLVALNQHFGHPLAKDDLLELAAQLGSDVPFSLTGGTCLGKGRGEQLEKIPIEPGVTFVLVKPIGLSVSTAWAYDAFDRSARHNGREIQGLLNHYGDLKSQLLDKNVGGVAQLLVNDFESVVFEHQPVLKKIQANLLKLGCLSAHMTGSGPTMYGLAANAQHAKQILSQMEPVKNHATGFAIDGVLVNAWLANSINHGIKVVEDDEKP